MHHPMHGYDNWYGCDLMPEEKVQISSDESTMLFVYGALKKGYKYHDIMLGMASKFLGVFETEPNYLLYDTGPYPGMIVVKDGEGRCIEGELYEVLPSYMLKLDKNVPYSFKKKEIKLKGIDFPKIITHVWDWSVEKFLDCGTSWPRT